MNGRNFQEFRHEPCPICEHRGWCRRFTDGAIQCMRTESAHPCRPDVGGWMHNLEGAGPADWRDRIAASIPPAPLRRDVDPDVADAAYRALLTACPLSDTHRDHLHRRGLTDEQIERHGYATFPAGRHAQARIAADVLTRLDQTPAGRVPGFLLRSDQLVLVDLPGLLIPMRGVDGRIGGLHVRRDGANPKPKYVWFSGGDAEGSVGQNGHTLTVARPVYPVTTKRVLVVEGGPKANISADRYGVITIGVPGVSNIGEVLAAVRELGDVEEVSVAYDADAATNRAVAEAESRLVLTLDAGLPDVAILQAIWPAEAGKGLDDIAQRTPPVIPLLRPHPALPQSGPDTPPGRDDEPVPPRDQLTKLYTLSRVARRAKNLGAERHTLTEFALLTANADHERFTPLPYEKLGAAAGVSAATAGRHLALADIDAKAEHAGIFDGLVEVKLLRPAGASPDSHPCCHVRRIGGVDALLQRIADAPVPAGGVRNGHGGRRCACGGELEIVAVTTITERRCLSCGTITREKKRRAVTGWLPDDHDFHDESQTARTVVVADLQDATQPAISGADPDVQDATEPSTQTRLGDVLDTVGRYS